MYVIEVGPHCNEKNYGEFIVFSKSETHAIYMCICSHLWDEYKDACFAGIDDGAYGVNAGAKVVAVEVAVLHKLVVSDVPLHALSRHKHVLLLLFLSWLCWTRRVYTERCRESLIL